MRALRSARLTADFARQGSRSGRQALRPPVAFGTLRRGIALPIALAAIMVIGALISGVFFAATQEYRVGQGTMVAQQASTAAEVGLASAVASWTPERTASAKIGRTVTMPPDTINGAVVQVQYARVSPRMFVVTSTALAGARNVRNRTPRRVGTVVQTPILDLAIRGALTVRGNVTATGAATITGNDTTPPGWNDCLPAGSPRAGLVVGDSAKNVSAAGECTGYKCLYGEPKIADSSIYADSLTYQNFGGFTYDSLTKLATPDKIYTTGATIEQRQPVYTDGTKKACATTDLRNWGDTSHVDADTACDSYFPVVWLKGTDKNWTVSNFGGQGVLLVDGNVTFNGLFTYKGLIIVQGTVTFSGDGNAPRILGAVVAMNRKNGTHTIQGQALVRYSRCTLQAVASRLAGVRPIRYRAWTDMSH